MEQIRLANQQSFGRQMEKLDDIAGQLSFFYEAEANCDEAAQEPAVEEVIASIRKMLRKSKKKGQWEEDLKDFSQEKIPHDIPEKELNEAVKETGNIYQMRFSGSFVLNRPNGLQKNTS